MIVKKWLHKTDSQKAFNVTQSFLHVYVYSFYFKQPGDYWTVELVSNARLLASLST